MFWGIERGRIVRLTSPPSVSPLCRQCEIFDISQTYWPPGPVTGIAFLLPYQPSINQILGRIIGYHVVTFCWFRYTRSVTLFPQPSQDFVKEVKKISTLLYNKITHLIFAPWSAQSFSTQNGDFGSCTCPLSPNTNRKLPRFLDP
jgi:hypothetical protein